MALCPTPDTRALSVAELLDSRNRSQLAWEAAPAGIVARYRCDPGYLPVGDSERRCQTDGTWTGDALRCRKSEAHQSRDGVGARSLPLRADVSLPQPLFLHCCVELDTAYLLDIRHQT